MLQPNNLLPGRWGERASSEEKVWVTQAGCSCLKVVVVVITGRVPTCKTKQKCTPHNTRIQRQGVSPSSSQLLTRIWRYTFTEDQTEAQEEHPNCSGVDSIYFFSLHKTFILLKFWWKFNSYSSAGQGVNRTFILALSLGSNINHVMLEDFLCSGGLTGH